MHEIKNLRTDPVMSLQHLTLGRKHLASVIGLVRISLLFTSHHSGRARAHSWRSTAMAKIKTGTDFASLYFSRKCTEWREANLLGQSSINHAERYCSFEQDK